MLRKFTKIINKTPTATRIHPTINKSLNNTIEAYLNRSVKFIFPEERNVNHIITQGDIKINPNKIKIIRETLIFFKRFESIIMSYNALF